MHLFDVLSQGAFRLLLAYDFANLQRLPSTRYDLKFFFLSSRYLICTHFRVLCLLSLKAAKCRIYFKCNCELWRYWATVMSRCALLCGPTNRHWPMSSDNAYALFKNKLDIRKLGALAFNDFSAFSSSFSTSNETWSQLVPPSHPW